MNKKTIIGLVVASILLVISGCNNTKTQTVSQSQPKTDILDDKVSDIDIPDGCVTWFDGCNNCIVGEPDQPMACTKMACKETQEPYCAKYEDGSSDAPIEIIPVSPEVEIGIKNATYNVEGESVTLANGMVEMEAAPGSATKIVTQTTNFMAEGDLQQGTGATLDGAVVLTQDPGGSGTFYYIGAILQQSDGTYVAANGTYLLGDRIIIKNIKIEERMIYVTYLIREDDVPMSMNPTVEVVKQYATKGDVLMDVTPDDVPNDMVVQEEMVGNDKDEHGCIGSAGYAWDEQTQKCERPWE